jgi:hypothetical protein
MEIIHDHIPDVSDRPRSPDRSSSIRTSGVFGAFSGTVIRHEVPSWKEYLANLGRPSRFNLKPSKELTTDKDEIAALIEQEKFVNNFLTNDKDSSQFPPTANLTMVFYVGKSDTLHTQLGCSGSWGTQGGIAIIPSKLYDRLLSDECICKFCMKSGYRMTRKPRFASKKEFKDSGCFPIVSEEDYDAASRELSRSHVHECSAPHLNEDVGRRISRRGVSSSSSYK